MFMGSRGVTTLATALLLLGAGCAEGTQQLAPQGTGGRGDRCLHGVAFIVDLVPGARGEPTPIEAARWFAEHGGVDTSYPVDGWHVVRHHGKEVTLRSGTAVLRAVQGPAGTWGVTSGHHCS